VSLKKPETTQNRWFLVSLYYKTGSNIVQPLELVQPGIASRVFAIMKDMENKDIKLKEGTIRHLQEYIEQKLKERKFDDETLHERLLLLTEEVGELINACRKLTGMNVDEAREITNQAGEELTDVINMIFSVGIKLGLDMEKEFRNKEERIDKRRYKRTSREID